jgi:N-acetylneuraminic acid mutarotase
MRKIGPGIKALLILALAVLSASCGGGNSNATGATLGPSCSPSSSPKGGATASAESCWTQIKPLGSGGFPAVPGSNDRPLWEPGKIPVGIPPSVAFNGDLWMTGQINSWSSSDGVTWTIHDKTDTGSRIWQTTVFFDNYLWTFGGMEYATRTVQNDIWRSADGSTWEKAGAAAWSPRKGAAVIVYQGKLWLFGGATHVQSDFTADQLVNDVWTSADGLNWTQVTDAAPWSPLDDPRVTVLNDAVYLLGGGGRSDVWRSTDGKNWEQLTAEAPWKPRYGYSAIVFDGKMWAYGGYVGKSTNAVNDVWYSSDGATWVQQTEHAPWGPRDPLSVIFQDKLWIFSGKHTGGKDSWGGDVWQMTSSPYKTS